MHSGFMLPVEKESLNPVELYEVSMFYMFLLGYSLYVVISSSFKFKEISLMNDLYKYQNLVRKINYRFDIFKNESNMDVDDMLVTIDNFDGYTDSSGTDSSGTDSSGTDSSGTDSNGTDSNGTDSSGGLVSHGCDSDSDKLNESEEEVEKAGLILSGMSQGKNWFY